MHEIAVINTNSDRTNSSVREGAVDNVDCSVFIADATTRPIVVKSAADHNAGTRQIENAATSIARNRRSAIAPKGAVIHRQCATHGLIVEAIGIAVESAVRHR